MSLLKINIGEEEYVETIRMDRWRNLFGEQDIVYFVKHEIFAPIRNEVSISVLKHF